MVDKIDLSFPRFHFVEEEQTKPIVFERYLGKNEIMKLDKIKRKCGLQTPLAKKNFVRHWDHTR